MGLLSCCYAPKDHESGGKPPTAPSQQPQAAVPNAPVAPVIANVNVAKDAGFTDNAPPKVSSVPPLSTYDVSRLHALQVALGSIDGDGFEARASMFVETIQDHLGPASVVRLLGIASGESSAEFLYLVQLAASASPTLVAPQWCEQGLPGSSFPLALSADIDSAASNKGGIKAEGRDPLLLLERALLSKEPAVYHADRSAVAALERPQGAHPRDCLADMLLIRGSTPLTFAALPLTCSRRLVGVLWIVIEHPGSQNDSQHGGPMDDRATTAMTSRGFGWTLLGNPGALAQLALAASMALTAAAPDPEYIRWLASGVRRLASSTNLHTLVAGVCSAVAKHVRLRFHTDVAVQSALVPEPDSHVGFMLCPETKASAPPSGSPCVAVTLRDVAPVGPLQGGELGGVAQPRPKSGILVMKDRKPLRRTASQAVLSRSQQRIIPVGGLRGSDGDDSGGRSGGGAGRGARDAPATVVAARLGYSLPPMADQNTARTLAHARDRDRDRDRDPLLEAIGNAARSLGTGSAFSAPAMLFSLSAKAFQMSHTLLCRLIYKARAMRPPPLVPPGVVVADMARHVADVRQPSRDVCMLMGSKGTMQAAALQPSSAWGAPNMDPSGSRGGVASMVLLAMEVAEGGCMLGLYLVFPTLTPQPLLSAVHDSCRKFLSKMLVHLVRYKLRSPELGPDFETLRAGVPGSYMSVLRLRDAVDRLQLSPDPHGKMQNAHQHQSHLHQQQPQQPPRTLRQSPMQDAPSGSPEMVPWVSGANDQQQHAQRSPDVDMRRASIMDSFTADPTMAQSNAASGVATASAAGATVTGPGSAVHDMARDLEVVVGDANSLDQTCQGNNRMVSASGIPSGAGMGSQGAASVVTLDSTIDAGVDAQGPARFAPAAMMMVHDLDETWGMRGMMGALVESIMTTLRVSASELAETVNGNDIASRAAEGLEDLHLTDVLGHGASGVVLRGLLGTVPVAVKLMEMPDADQDPLSSEVGLSSAMHGQHPLTQSQGLQQQQQTPPIPQTPQKPQTQGQGQQHSREPFVRSLASMLNSLPNSSQRRTAAQELQCDGEVEEELTAKGLVPFRVQQTESEQMRARRTMLRNATELAVMRTVSHVSIVQAFAVYDNVIMERSNAHIDGFVLRRLDARNPQTGGSPICTAIVQELCDRGTLGDVLADGSFPIMLTPRSVSPHHYGHQQQQQQPHASRGRERTRGGSELDMRTVYLTLLEIALALRHLHARRLVHRDLKPANILLKTIPGDYRGWTCKLADFGFALVLDQQDTAAEAKEYDSSGSGPSPHHMRGQGPGSEHGHGVVRHFGNGSTGGAPRGWYTIQAEASGTVTHMAPEAVRKNSRIDASVDIYALGIICWELVCGKGQRPFRSLDPESIPAAVMAGLRPVFTPDVPVAYRKLAMACWSHDPYRRPRAGDVVAYIKQQLAQLH